jgi:hypothetical protein
VWVGALLSHTSYRTKVRERFIDLRERFWRSMLAQVRFRTWLKVPFLERNGGTGHCRASAVLAEGDLGTERLSPRLTHAASVVGRDLRLELNELALTHVLMRTQGVLHYCAGHQEPDESAEQPE